MVARSALQHVEQFGDGVAPLVVCVGAALDAAWELCGGDCRRMGEISRQLAILMSGDLHATLAEELRGPSAESSRGVEKSLAEVNEEEEEAVVEEMLRLLCESFFQGKVSLPVAQTLSRLLCSALLPVPSHLTLQEVGNAIFEGLRVHGLCPLLTCVLCVTAHSRF